MLNKLKNLFKKPAEVVEVPEPKKPRQPRKPKSVKPKVEEVTLSAKDIANAANEPYVAILSVDVDPANINNGAFELDWNEKFVLNLIRAGYKMRDDDKDSDIVDRWFQTVCRNIVLEVYEQEQADPENRDVRPPLNKRDLGNGRTEVS